MKKFSEKIKKKYEDFINEESATEGSKTRMLFVKGTDRSPDYAAVFFEDKYFGTPVDDIIANPDDYMDYSGVDGEWVLEVMEFEKIDPKFLEFLFRHDMIDYETTKDKMFFFEGEGKIIGK
jgi:hypothetical protein